MKELTYKDLFSVSDAFISDMQYLQNRLESLAEEERNSETLDYGAHGCIHIFGVSEVLKRRIEQYRITILEIDTNEQQKNKTI